MNNNNNIQTLREALYNQLQNLQDPNCNLDKEIKRSQAINEVSEQIINTAKVEVAYSHAFKTHIPANGFVPMIDASTNLLENGTKQ